jgi:hypothetical protein
MIREYDIVALIEARPDDGLARGAVGTVVLVYDDGAAFEVEFVTPGGETIAVLTLAATLIRPVREDEIARGNSKR